MEAAAKEDGHSTNPGTRGKNWDAGSGVTNLVPDDPNIGEIEASRIHKNPGSPRWSSLSGTDHRKAITVSEMSGGSGGVGSRR